MFSTVSTTCMERKSDRAQLSRSISDREIDALASDNAIRTVQFFNSPEESVWQRLNDRLFKRRPDVSLRVYGFPDEICDLHFCAQLPNVQSFTLETWSTVGLDFLKAMEQLKSFSFGGFNLDNYDFLNNIPSGLQSLSISPSRTKKPDLSVLARFTGLRKLYLDHQPKGLAVIGELKALEDLTIRSITLKDLEILRRLPKLWSLDIKLGGTKDLSALEGLENLKYLELWQILGLSDISVISTLTGLQFLFLQSLKRIETLPKMTALSRLRKVHIENMRSLRDISSLLDAPILEEISHVDNRTITLANYFAYTEKESLEKD